MRIEGTVADDPLVTIVTPSFNQGRFIRATIESVLEQDYPRIEYIVMDGGSSDETAAVVAEYGDRLTWVSEPDRGQSHAINKGFRMARGEVVAWINSDDLLLPGAVSRAVAALREHPGAGAVYGEGLLIDGEGRVKGRFPATEPFDLWKLVHLWDYVLQQTVYFRKSVLDEVGYLDEALNWALDWEILIRIGCRYELAYVPEEMGALREHDEAKTSVGGHRRFRELVTVVRRYGHHRYPPAYFLYGLDTYGRAAAELAERWLPSGLAAAARRRLERFTVARMQSLLREGKGVYGGGWATARVEWMVPAAHRRLRVRGTVPDVPGLDRQRLTVTAGPVTLAERRLGPGDFEIEVAVPDAAPGARRPLVVLRAERFVSAAAVGLRRDQRPVAYLLREVVGLP